MKSIALKILPVLLIILASHMANAQTTCSGSTIMLNTSCSATSGSKQIWDCNDIYNFDMMFCNNTEYLSLGISIGTTCTAGSLGVMQWNDAGGTNGTGFYEFCDGTNWWTTKGKQFATCTGTDRKKQRWNTPSMQFCDGSNWYVMGPTVVRLTTSQTYVIPTYANGIIIQVWGGGGGGGAGANATGVGATGGNSTAAIASIGLSLTSNAGVGGKDGANGTPGGGGLGGTASATATGPPSAISVTSVNGASGDTSGANPAAGNGGAADHGGKAGAATAAKGNTKISKDGGTPGSGGAGDNGNNSSRRGGGGGGAAGYSRVYYTDTGLSGLSLVVTVGAKGNGSNASAGDGGVGLVMVTYW